MPFTTLISPSELIHHLDDPDWAVVDCRFSLAEPDWGRESYLRAHIPGAVYAHLAEDLSGPVIPGVTGRHPLPEPGDAAARFSAWGIGPGVQVVVYDDAGGAYAARLWWMLRWLGHTAVAVLDGGWQSWQHAGLPQAGGEETRSYCPFTLSLRPEMVVSAAEVDAMLRDPEAQVLDARSADRYRGENETIDPVAGHIPGALSAPYAENLTKDLRFLPVEELRSRFSKLLGSITPENTAVYCGSGVTAAHNLIAMLHAGLGEARLYPGSWSEWIADRSRPVETG